MDHQPRLTAPSSQELHVTRRPVAGVGEGRYRFPGWWQRLNRRLDFLPNEASFWVSDRGGDLNAYAAPAFDRWAVPDGPYRAEVLAMVKDSPTDQHTGHRPVPVEHIDRLVTMHRESEDEALDKHLKKKKQLHAMDWDDAYRGQRR